MTAVKRDTSLSDEHIFIFGCAAASAVL